MPRREDAEVRGTGVRAGVLHLVALCCRCGGERGQRETFNVQHPTFDLQGQAHGRLLGEGRPPCMTGGVGGGRAVARRPWEIRAGNEGVFGIWGFGGVAQADARGPGAARVSYARVAGVGLPIGGDGGEAFHHEGTKARRGEARRQEVRGRRGQGLGAACAAQGVGGKLAGVVVWEGRAVGWLGGDVPGVRVGRGSDWWGGRSKRWGSRTVSELRPFRPFYHISRARCGPGAPARRVRREDSRHAPRREDGWGRGNRGGGGGNTGGGRAADSRAKVMIQNNLEGTSPGVTLGGVGEPQQKSGTETGT